jgi:hypothetical protein
MEVKAVVVVVMLALSLLAVVAARAASHKQFGERLLAPLYIQVVLE